MAGAKQWTFENKISYYFVFERKVTVRAPLIIFQLAHA